MFIIFFFLFLQQSEENMKVKVNKPWVTDVYYLEVMVPSSCLYPEDFALNGNEVDIEKLPLFNEYEKCLHFYVSLHNGKVMDWPENKKVTLETWAKIVDVGRYWLASASFLERVIESKSHYVPNMLDTRGDGFGDYFQFKINENGYIENWNPDLSDFDVELIVS